MLGLHLFLVGRDPDVEFKTSLSIDDCKKRLLQELHRKRKIFGFRYPPPPIVEYVIGNYFLVSRNQSFFYRDNLLVLGGQLKPTREGTLVRASFRLYEGISIILLLGFCLFFGFAGLAFLLMLRLRKSQRDELASYLKYILTPLANSNELSVDNIREQASGHNRED